MTNEKFVRGLRELADFYEQHPQLKAPDFYYFHLYAHTADELREQVKLLGHCTKSYFGTDITFRKNFTSGLFLDVVANRREVCKKKVVGIKHVEATFIPAHDEEI